MDMDMMDVVVMNRAVDKDRDMDMDVVVMDRDIDMDVNDMDRYMDMGGPPTPWHGGSWTEEHLSTVPRRHACCA